MYFVTDLTRHFCQWASGSYATPNPRQCVSAVQQSLKLYYFAFVSLPPKVLNFGIVDIKKKMVKTSLLTAAEYIQIYWLSPVNEEIL